jgi:formylglycine-generating enzyme required for sulfatase activity
VSAEQDPIVAAALARGFLSAEQLAEATQAERALAAEGRSPGLRALLAQRYLRPEQVDALRRGESVTRQYEATHADADPVVGRPVELGPGALVGNYVIDRLLGKGGMGAVFAGHDPSSGMKVAIKVLAARDPKALERFRREGVAQAAADRHPNVARVFATGEQQGAPFLVMELCEGGDLVARLKGGPLPFQEAARLVAGLARGLAHVHAKGTLHRDLKPANVLFDEAGTPKLVDFGVARLSGEQSLTRTGDVVGTPAYMAPEQAEGAKDGIDERTDVYGLGAVLYHVVSGRPPFEGDGVPQVLKQVLLDAPAPPSSVVDGVPRDLEHVVLKALSKDPADRYPSAKALADDLERLARGEPVLGRDEAGARRRAQRTRRALGAAVVAAGLVGGGVALWRTWPRIAAYFGPAPAALRPLRGTFELRHPKQSTTLAWATVSARVEGSARAARLVIRDRAVVQAAIEAEAGWSFDDHVQLDLGPNVVRLEAQAADDSRWVTLGQVTLERRVEFEPPPPAAVKDRKGRELRLDEATETYAAHDGSQLVYVPPRTFQLGSEECEYGLELGGLLDAQMAQVSAPVHQVSLSSGFLIGKHEVTVRQLEQHWLAAGEVGPPPRRETSWTDDHPAVEMTFQTAEAYCEWAGLALPTEVQWELAARGPKGRRYPWGDDAGEPTPAVFDRYRGKRAPEGYERARPRSVRGLDEGASWVGALHMAGNVWEWTQDVFTPTYGMLLEMKLPAVDRCFRGGDDPPPHARRVIRGGCWKSPLPELHGAYRRPEPGDLSEGDEQKGWRPRKEPDDDVGFRVVLTLPPP